MMTLEDYFYPKNFSIMKRKNKHGLYITSQELSELLGIKHSSIKRAITANESILNKYRPLRSYGKTKKYTHGGAPQFIFYLNEEQAIFLIFNARNNKKSLRLKEQAIEYIFKMRKAIDEYNKYSNLLLKSVTGMNATKLKAVRGDAKTGLDLLTVEEQERYEQNEHKTIAYIEAGFTYKQIKALLNGAKMFVAIDEK
ncbi:Rha family transcriptional regulator [Lactobacillus sp. AN1001]